MRRILSVFAVCFGLAGCGVPAIEENPDPIGDFRLGFLVPTASPNLTKAPVSREASAEEWNAAMEAAFQPRFAPYEGASFYHLGVITEGYLLAPPGIPVVLSPKSVLIFSVMVIDDSTQTTLTEEPEQFTVLEEASPATFVGSGLTRSKEQQMASLATNAAVRVERWMRTQPWFYEDGVIPAEIAAEIASETAPEIVAETATGPSEPVPEALEGAVGLTSEAIEIE